jgi:hypothetical protein
MVPRCDFGVQRVGFAVIPKPVLPLPDLIDSTPGNAPEPGGPLPVNAGGTTLKDFA